MSVSRVLCHVIIIFSFLCFSRSLSISRKCAISDIILLLVTQSSLRDRASSTSCGAAVRRTPVTFDLLVRIVDLVVL